MKGNNFELVQELDVSSNAVHIDTYQGVLPIVLDLCVNIVKENFYDTKQGTCGVCETRTKIKEYKKQKDAYDFLYLCSSCESTLQTELEEKFKNHSTELTSYQI